MRTIRNVSLCAFLMLLVALPVSWAGVSIGVSVRIGPPPIPVYVQPVCPAPGYLWTPGYWAYSEAGYYWVPGTWVRPPEVGVLWTPGYWGWGGAGYIWHAGYWGPHVGFYGGINYGFGYAGVGFVGGRWDRGVFRYNTAVMHVDTRIVHTTYVDRTVVRDVHVSRVSYDGGQGGLRARPTPYEDRAMHERHSFATDEQMRHEHSAASDRAFRASENHGRPAVGATARPGEFGNHGSMHDGPRGMENPHNVPHPPSHSARPEPTSFHGNGHAQPEGSRGPSPSHGAHADHNDGGQHHDSADRHDGRGHNR